MAGEATVMSEQVKEQMASNMLSVHRRLDDAAVRQNDHSNFVHKQSEELFLLTKQLVGATAQNIMEKNGIASDILQNRAVGGQPQAAGGPQPVPPQIPNGYKLVPA